MRTISMAIGVLLIINGGRPLNHVNLVEVDSASVEIEVGDIENWHGDRKSEIIR